ncbi:Predicted DNA-binding transcriptional regulator YafY, contains an HTH and WYL domains [Muriicola jejuensis]|uniref:WYL domain-containing protein n=1 Tax=Muriicola jejuensis TaxID=504488 RepID=A0A6P0UBN4_9FLAO|nr:WYL domain-containing protein [Muriicola jejuensis]NER10022.1 WYL domain-containing protein [Muriicola jejuensis]SMP03691.1 Predicted DNA-binding transcriptional regulator YafY, contains an HTH and WYL domains [Muriicola jejuensis]
MSKYPNIERLVLIKNLLSVRPRSSAELLSHIEEKGGLIESARTIARDIKVLRDLGYEIENPTKIRGYLLVNTGYKEDLLERYNDYLKLSKLPETKNEDGLITTPQLRGVEMLPNLFKAVDDFYEIEFDHKGYTSKTKKTSEFLTWRVFPLLLKEYQSKWHLHTYVPSLTENNFRTFGIDRMSNLKLLAKFDPNRVPNADEEIELFKKRLGSAKPLDDYNYQDLKGQPQFIKIWVSSFYLNYLKAKKLHFTQNITNETKVLLNFAEKKEMTYTLVTYLLVPNYDLIKVIVAGLGDIILEQPESLKVYISNKFNGLISKIIIDKNPHR